MRLGVLDIGSNTVHMLVVDAYPGARPLPAFSHKVDLSLAAHLERGNTLSKVGEKRLTEVVEEALLTFLAARRWFGWSSGRLLVVDIGGGSLEIAVGQDEEPEAVMSLPLGAGRLTRDWFTADPPPPGEVRALRRHVRAEVARMAGGLRRGGAVDHAVGTSKTFRQLARIAGAAPSNEGFYAKRFLKHADVSQWAERLASLDRTD